MLQRGVFSRSRDVCPTGQNLTPDTKNPDWLARRAKLNVTGTTFCAHAPHGGIRGYQTLPQQYKRIVYNWKPDMSFAQYRMSEGNKYEDVVREKFEAATGKKVYEVGLLVAHEEETWGGSPDGIDVNHEFILEIKCLTSRSLVYDELGQAMVPTYYLAQALWYMYLTGIERCAFAQYDISKDELAVTWLDYDADTVEPMLANAREFTQRVKEEQRKWVELQDKMLASLSKLKTEHTEPMDRIQAVRAEMDALFEEAEAQCSLIAPAPLRRAKRKKLDGSEDHLFKVDDSLVQAAKKFQML